MQTSAQFLPNVYYVQLYHKTGLQGEDKLVFKKEEREVWLRGGVYCN